MFTGIITDIGEIRTVQDMNGERRVVIGAPYPPENLALGASIACAGVCLTVTERGHDGDGDWFAADISAKTLAVTTAGDWQAGTRLNLERALAVGDELGGHIVTGHVDGIATIEEMTEAGDSVQLRCAAPPELARFIAAKGSVTLDGTSLTVNQVAGVAFTLNLIAHSRAVTTWGQAELGQRLNLEIDILARYVARLTEAAEELGDG